MALKRPIPRTTITDIERFFAKVSKEEDGCWQWTGAIAPNGYGRFRKFIAHRVCYYFYNGQPPTDLDLDHLCRNRGCVNPKHLEAVTRSVNLKRGIGVQFNKQKTHCKHGHEFTPSNTYRYQRPGRNPERLCKTCNMARSLKRYYATK